MVDRRLEMVVQLVANTKELSDGVSGIRGQLQTFGRSIVGLGAGLGLAYGVNEAIDFMGRAVDSASALEEATSRVGVVFGRSSEEVKTWAGELDSAFGVSERNAMSFVGTFGQVTKAMGLSDGEAAKLSMRLVELGGDLASFSNVDIEQALNALRSGLSGETEPLKQLGIVLNDTLLREAALREGIIASDRVLTTREKVLAFQAELWRQTADAQGDALRTADTYAGAQRRLGALTDDLVTRVGGFLLPYWEGIAETGVQLLDIIERLEISLPAVGDQSTNALAALDPWAGILSAIIGPAGQAAQRIEELAGTVGLSRRQFAEGLGASGLVTPDDLRNVVALADTAQRWVDSGLAQDYADSLALLGDGLEDIGPAAVEAQRYLEDMPKVVASTAREIQREIQGTDLRLEDIFQISGDPFDDLLPKISPRKFVAQINKELRSAIVELDKFLDNPESDKKLTAAWQSIGKKVERLAALTAKTADLNTAGGNLMTVFGAAVLSEQGKAVNSVQASFDALGLKGKGSFLRGVKITQSDFLEAMPPKASWDATGVAFGAAFRAGFIRAVGDLRSVLPSPTSGGVGGTGDPGRAFRSGDINITINAQGADPFATETAVLGALRRAGGANGGVTLSRIRPAFGA